MAHFAEMNKEFVQRIIVVNNEVLENKPFPESEPIGVAFLKSIYGEDTEWKQTSYNSNFRGRYANGAMIYDEELDEFRYPGEPAPTE